MSDNQEASTSGSNPPPRASAPIPIKRNKRRRTRSHNSSPSPGRGFFVPGFDVSGSPSSNHMMSLSDVMDAAKGISNMYLAHEIAVNKDFMLQDLKPEESAMEKQVKEIVHKAFWDILDQQLKEDPPVYEQAMMILKEIKEGILSLLVPQQKRAIDSINEKFDVELISQQAENGVLNFQDYASYVLNLMVQLCAPVRDDEIAKLKTVHEVVPLFKGIMEALDHMKLDMANFHVQQARPMIVSQSVEYEKAKFKEFLEKQPSNGLEITTQWLKGHSPQESEIQDSKYHKLLKSRIISEAYLDLLEWDDYNLLPETLVMDQKRIEALRDATERTSVSTGVILLTFSNISGFVIPMHAQGLKERIKKHIDILLEDFFDDADLLKLLPNVAAQVVKDINDYLAENEKPLLPDSTRKTLEDQIAEMEDPNHRIRDLVQRRILEFNKQAISASRTAPLQVPPGLTLCQKDLAQIAGNFVRLVNYNRAVFGEFYDEIIENQIFFKTDKEKEANREA